MATLEQILGLQGYSEMMMMFPSNSKARSKSRLLSSCSFPRETDVMFTLLETKTRRGDGKFEGETENLYSKGRRKICNPKGRIQEFKIAEGGA